MLETAPRQPRILVCGCGCGCPEVLRDALPEASFDVVSCTTPETLLERTLQRVPDLILCQVGGMSEGGTNLLRLIRRFLPETPLVLVSEGASLETRRLAQDLRPSYFLLAPWEGSELREVVASFLRPARTAPVAAAAVPVAAESASNGGRPVVRKR